MAEVDNLNSTRNSEVRNKNKKINFNTCHICGKNFKSVAIHISKAHPDAYRENITSKYLASDQNSDTSSKNAKPCDKLIEVLQNNSYNPSDLPEEISNMIRDFERKFTLILNGNDTEYFESTCTELTEFLAKAISSLRGPKHPAVRYYNARKKKQAGHTTTFSKSKNPARLTKRNREESRRKYQYELAQYHYYNQRRKVVRNIMTSQNGIQCKIPVSVVSDHFQNLFENENELTTLQLSEAVCTEEDIEITESEINTAIARIRSDTASGPDGVILRALKELKVTKLLCLLGNAMLKFKKCPDIFKKARTILIHKGGCAEEITNWRPITIFSIIRRVIEKVIDARLRRFLEFSVQQRGFVRLPGTHVNTSIINGCLQNAKTNRKDCCVVFIDVSKAYDNVGHEHIRRCLNRINMPNNLRDLVHDLISGNNIAVECGINRTEKIQLHKGLAQGSPISPALFNLAIDDIIKELTDDEVTEALGYQLSPDLKNVSALAFADDIVLVARNEMSSQSLLNIAVNNLSAIGLTVNPLKCNAINVKKGHLCQGNDITIGANVLQQLRPGEIIKYLGVTFQEEIIFDQGKIIRNLEKDLNSLKNSLLLKPDQKLNIMNQYIWPGLIYPLQSTPLNKISPQFLADVDKIIRSTVKEIIGLPHDCPNDMMYAPRNVRGLGLIKAEWEAHIQHFNIAQKLLRINDEHLQFCRDLNTEKGNVLQHLNIPNTEDTSSKSGRWIRNEMRKRSYNAWCKLPHKGKGVEVYEQHIKSNSWMNTRKTMSCSEWTNAIKMSCNISAVRAVPGRNPTTNICRQQGCDEPETLAHVLGKCSKGELLRNSRHHRVRSSIATHLRKLHWEVYEEVHCISEDGSNRRADIICINRKDKRAYILDPTVRIEQDNQQAVRVNKEKEDIYRPCIPHLSERYNLPVNAWAVKGLLFGARGSVFKFSMSVLKDMGFFENQIEDMSVKILKDSICILHNHLYSPY